LLALALVAGCAAERDPRTPASPGSAPGATPGAAPGSIAPSAGPTIPPSTTQPTAVALVPGEPEVIASGLGVPWGLAFLPGGNALVAERDSGRILEIQPDGATVEIGRIEDLGGGGEGGLLGLAMEPGGDRIYAYYDTGSESRIVRFRPGEAPEVVVDGITATPFHTGGRIAFGPDAKLYAAVGDAQDGAAAQDPASPAGKILRFDPDGAIPADNPDPASPVWALGLRNVEGLAWDAAGRLWATEFGEAAADELNLIEPGANYGWPHVEGSGGAPRFVDPVVTWTPDVASPSGLAFAHGSLWVAALRGARLWRVGVAPDGTLATPEPLLVGAFGRLRTVEPAPDGSLWIATSNRDGRGVAAPDDDRIIRVPMVPPP
jgi:glucose/arabinose dehydrogenase